MNIDPNKMATTLAIEEENEFATEWFAPEDQKEVYFEEINLEKELLSKEENSITTYSPGVPKQPSQPSAKGEHLTFGSITEELLELMIEYQAQEDTIGKLTYKMEELNNTILELQEMVKSYPSFGIENWSKEPGSKEEDYSADQTEAYFEEKSNEYFQISRDDVEYDSTIEDSTSKMRTSHFFSSTFFITKLCKSQAQ